MGLADDVVRSVGREIRTDLRKLVLPGLLALAAGLSALAGIGFLTAWAYLALSAAVGHAPAALLTGLGYLVVCAVLLFLARRLVSRPERAEPAHRAPRPRHQNETGDAASQIAFTAAFVLGRYLGDNTRDS